MSVKWVSTKREPLNLNPFLDIQIINLRTEHEEVLLINEKDVKILKNSCSIVSWRISYQWPHYRS